MTRNAWMKYTLLVTLSLLVAALLIAGFYVQNVQRERDRRIGEAKEAIQSVGGHIGAMKRPGEYSVYLADTNVDDEALAVLEPHLLAIPLLVEVNLNGTRITDRGLAYLPRRVELMHIEMCDTAVTDQGAKSLAEALPNCRVT